MFTNINSVRLRVFIKTTITVEDDVASEYSEEKKKKTLNDFNLMDFILDFLRFRLGIVIKILDKISFCLFI